MKEEDYVPLDDVAFSLAHPVKDRILDTDVFLHGTSSIAYEAIKKQGLKLDIDSRNFPISSRIICFEKVPENEGLQEIVLDGLKKRYCRIACHNDNCSEGVILQITGADLKKLGCNIHMDPEHLHRKYDCETGLPYDVDMDFMYVSICVVDTDIPAKFLKEFDRVIIKD